MVSFDGLEPWFDDFPRIDFQTPAGLVDLHNNAIFEKLYFSIVDTFLGFHFRYSREWCDISSSNTFVELKFGEVANLRLTQADDYDTRAASTLEGVVRELQLKESRFSVDLGDLQCQFDAQFVVLRMGSSAGRPLQIALEG